MKANLRDSLIHVSFHSRHPEQGQGLRLSDLHLIHDAKTGRDQSACALLIKLTSLFAGPPGSRWRRCQAAGARGRLRALAPPAHPFTLRLPPGATRVAWFFRPLPWPYVLARLRIAGTPRLDEPWNRSPPRPWHSAWAQGARKRLEFVSRHSD